jgi:hypothetical protein
MTLERHLGFPFQTALIYLLFAEIPMGNILILVAIALTGFGMFLLLSRKKLTDYQRLLLRLQDPALNLDTLIAELRYSKMLHISQDQRLEILKQALVIFKNHPQEKRCQDFALDFSQWYCAVSGKNNHSFFEKNGQPIQADLWAQYRELGIPEELLPSSLSGFPS